MSSIAYGLIMYELERVDSGFRSFASAQGALVMYSILSYGSTEQKEGVPAQSGKGSDHRLLRAERARGGLGPRRHAHEGCTKDGDSYILNGTKMWITSGQYASIAVIWARDDEDTVRGFIVPASVPGFTANPIKRKMSLRISETSELVLDDVRVPSSQMLPDAKGLSAPLSCLTLGRFGLAWGALGALEAVYTEGAGLRQEPRHIWETDRVAPAGAGQA